MIEEQKDDNGSVRPALQQYLCCLQADFSNGMDLIVSKGFGCSLKIILQ
jgi:hypothetical protein